MTINCKRIFRSEEGTTYKVVNSLKADIENGAKKYYITRNENGFEKTCCDIGYNTLRFDTIKSAQRYVSMWGDNYIYTI